MSQRAAAFAKRASTKKEADAVTPAP